MFTLKERLLRFSVLELRRVKVAEYKTWHGFVFSEHELPFVVRYVVACPPVCRLSVTLVHPTQLVEIFGNFSMRFGTMAKRWHPRKILRRSS